MKHKQDKNLLIKKVLEREKLLKLQGNRLKRLLRDPVRTLPFYFLSILARFYPINVTTKTLWGDKMSFYLPEGNQVYYYGFCEANLTNFLIRFLKQGDTFIDIGSNIGFYSFLASYLVQDNGKIFSIEPTPRTFETLKINSEGRNNVTVINTALSDEEKVVKFIDYGSRYSAFNTINPKNWDDIPELLKNKKELEITTSTMDKLAQKYNIEPSFIKIDAEGHESRILKGMSDLIDKTRPILSIEIGTDKEWRKNVTESFKILSEKNYRSFEILIDGYLKPRVLDEKTETNMIFIPTEKIDDTNYLIIK